MVRSLRQITSGTRLQDGVLMRVVLDKPLRLKIGKDWSVRLPIFQWNVDAQECCFRNRARVHTASDAVGSGTRSTGHAPNILPPSSILHPDCRRVANRPRPE